MTSLKERSVFFPSQKVDGRNKDLTKQHWQAFQDFCNQQKLYIENTDDHRAATINEVQPFFKMTLTDLARAWLERDIYLTCRLKGKISQTLALMARHIDNG